MNTRMETVRLRLGEHLLESLEDSGYNHKNCSNSRRNSRELRGASRQCSVYSSAMAQHQPDREAFRRAIHEIALGIHGGWIKSKANEAAVRQAIVLRLLQAAGFDIWNPLEVFPEESSATGGRADLSIGDGEKSYFILELKRLNATIKDKETEQALNYAYSKAIRWALATNGAMWCVYDIHLVNQLSSDRLVLELQLTKDNQEEFADDLFRLLDASVWAKNSFEDSVNQVLSDQKLRGIIATKTPALEKFMADNTVVDREKAIALMLELGRLESAEADALRGKTVSPLVTKNPVLICAGRGARATAVLLEGGVLEIQAGSTAARDMVQSFLDYSGKSWLKARADLIEQGKAKLRSDGLLEYVKAVQYTKPSTASVAILGRSSNGRTSWKTRDGKTYADLTKP